MRQLTTIAKEHQADVIYMFWILLKECEATVDNGDCKDIFLKNYVESGFRVWNQMTNSTDEPQWLQRERQREAEAVVGFTAP